MSFVPTYLMSRNGVWYFNCRIPSSIRNRYNINKMFIRKSLRTTNVYEAIQKSQKYTYLIMSEKKKGSGWKKISGQDKISEQERKLRQLEADQEVLNDALLVGREIVKAYDEIQKYGTYAKQTDFWMEYSEYEYECYRLAIDQINKEQKQIKQKREALVRKNARIFANEFHRAIGIKKEEPKKEKQEEETSITLNELIENFIKYKELDGTWKPRTLKLQKGRLGLIREFLEYAIGEENPMIHLFKSDHAIMFEEEFCHYPKNCNKLFPDMSLAEVMSQIDGVKFAKIDRISRNNYNEYAQLLMAVFKWAKNDKKRKYLVGENVFVDLKKTGEAPKSYSPFTNDEIKLFFGTDLFRNKQFKMEYAWRYWIPLIMLYHGMRLEECAQLLVKNIFKKNRVWCFDMLISVQ